MTSQIDIRPHNARASDRPRFLAVSPATRSDQLIAGGIAFIAVAFAVAITPFAANLAGPDTDLLSASYMGAIVALAICSILFFGQWRASRHAGTGFLASAFGFASFMLLFFWVEYPGTISDSGLIPLAPGAIGWLSAFWPCVFCGLVVMFVLTAGREEPWDAAVKLAGAVTAGLALGAVAILCFASASLPRLSLNGHVTPLYSLGLGPLVVACCALTAILLATVTRLQRWAEVYVAMFVIGIAARGYLNLVGPQRYSFGWYASRTELLLVSLAIVVALARQVSSIYAQLTRENRRLADAALIDGLTRVANRRAFDNELAALDEPASIAIIDLDYFKNLNDSFGHQAGDECLRLIARTLAANILRLEDLIARYGGDEFVAILRGSSLKDAVRVAERIRVAVDELKIGYGSSSNGGHVTVSIGVAASSPGETPTELLRRADGALYEAKEGGRGRVASAPAKLS